MSDTDTSCLDVHVRTFTSPIMQKTARDEFFEIISDFKTLDPGATPFIEITLDRDEQSDYPFYHARNTQKVAIIRERELQPLEFPQDKDLRRLLGHAAFVSMNDITINMIDAKLLWGLAENAKTVLMIVQKNGLAFLRSGPIAAGPGPVTARLLEDNLVFQIQGRLTAHERIEVLHQLAVSARAAAQDLARKKSVLSRINEVLPPFRFYFEETTGTI